MKPRNKAAVFILLGQSNAVGHGLPMEEKDMITTPLANVFGLHRRENQTFESTALAWSGYVSGGMNLAEEQDHTYSIANCLAARWQAHIDGGNAYGLPDLYVVQIAIGAEGVTEGYMWHPEAERRLIPGAIGTIHISLFPFSLHVFSLLHRSFADRDLPYEIIGLHWRGGENDVTADTEYLRQNLESLYTTMLEAFDSTLCSPPTVLHRIVCPDRMNDMDPTGQWLDRMHVINGVFDRLADKRSNVTVFDPRHAPYFRPDVRGNGLFTDDAVHFTRDVNEWVANGILEAYKQSHSAKESP